MKKLMTVPSLPAILIFTLILVLVVVGNIQTVKRQNTLTEEGGGYFEYHFTKRGETQPLPKRSYVQGFKPFGWVIGTGYYR